MYGPTILGLPCPGFGLTGSIQSLVVVLVVLVVTTMIGMMVLLHPKTFHGGTGVVPWFLLR